MAPQEINTRVSDFISAMEKRDSMPASQGMFQGFADAISSIREKPRYPGKSKPSDILGMSVSSGVDPWIIKGHITTSWIDDLIEETKPTIKHLGRPKAKS